MSVHSSLATRGVFGGARNVLRRAERFARLLNEGRISTDRSPFGLPKVRVVRVKPKKKAEEAKETKAAEGTAVAAAPAAEGDAKGPSPKK